MQQLLQGTLSLGDYGQLLKAYRRFHAAAARNLEMGYRQLRQVSFALSAKHPLDLLDADISHVDPAPDRHPAIIAPLASAAESVGWVWVVEGSVLGRVVIDRALHRMFDNQRAGRLFFQAQPDMARRWQDICAAVEAYGQDEQVCDAMAEGALSAFQCVERSLLGITP